MPAVEPTDRQLRAILYHIAHVCLEVERGLRPREHLEPYLTDAEYRRHCKRPLHPRRTGRTVLPTDIGHIHLDRHLPGQITAAIPTRETDDRWSALVLHCTKGHARGWRVDQLERLAAPNLTRDPAPRPATSPDLDTSIRRVEDECKLVEAAHRATTTRLRELRDRPATADSKEATRKLRQQQHTWKTYRGQLRDELDSLCHRRELLQQQQEPSTADLGRSSATDLSHNQLIAVLGRVPDKGWQRRLWEGVAEEIQIYRNRWDVTDPHTVLGEVPDNQTHYLERYDLAFTLRAIAPALGTGGKTSQERDLDDKNTTVGRAQDPDVGVER